MTHCLVFLTFYGLVFELCQPAFGQQFWNGTKAGMTREQVKALLGDQLKVTPPTKESKTQEPSYSTTYRLCGLTFVVGFYFTNSRLDREILLAQSLPRLPGVPDPSPPAARCLVDSYTDVYGKPTRRDDDDLIFGRGDTLVTVHIGVIGNSIGPIIVEYNLRHKEL